MNGVVRVKLYKGNVTIAGRKSDDSIFDANIATFEDDRGAYNQKDAEGFIRLFGLPLKVRALIDVDRHGKSAYAAPDYTEFKRD